MQRLYKMIVSLMISMILIVGLVVTSFADESPTALYDEWSSNLKQYTQEICAEYDVDYPLVLAIIYNESRFQSGAIHKNDNGTTDYGLMQVNEVNYQWLYENIGIDSMSELLDDKIGIRCGVALLSYHINAAGNETLGLLRYQVGEGAYRRMIKRGKYSNDTYERVVEYWNEYTEYLKEPEQTKQDSIWERLQIKWDYNTISQN